MSKTYDSITYMRLGKTHLIKATVTQAWHHKIRNGNIMTEAIVGDAATATRCVWFTKEPLTDLIVGNEYSFEGVYAHKYGRSALQKPAYKLTRKNQEEYLPAEIETPLVLAPSAKTSDSAKHNYASTVGSILVTCMYLAVPVFVVGSWGYNAWHDAQIRGAGGVTCKDVTSIDYDWNNDVRCTNSDGSTFYTDYSGGNKYGYNFPGN